MTELDGDLEDGPLVFVGHDGELEVRLEWFPAELEVIYVFSRHSPFAQCSPPVECTKVNAL
jgi:hypothetical protein